MSGFVKRALARWLAPEIAGLILPRPSMFPSSPIHRKLAQAGEDAADTLEAILSTSKTEKEAYDRLTSLIAEGRERMWSAVRAAEADSPQLGPHHD